jgi:two-component sensor histidine kinase
MLSSRAKRAAVRLEWHCSVQHRLQTEGRELTWRFKSS